MDWDKASLELNKKLEPEHVRNPPKGKYGQYIEGWHAIAEANRIFGFNGWSYRVDSVSEAMREIVEIPKARDTFQRQLRVSYLATVTVTVDGVTRQDIGMGSGHSSPDDVVAAIEGAAKESVTDALKRALRTFGNPFGLALYDKSKANVGVNPPSEHDSINHQPEQSAARMTITEQQEAVLDDLFKNFGDRGERMKHQLLEKQRIEKLGDLNAALFEQVHSRLMKAQKPQEAANAA